MRKWVFFCVSFNLKSMCSLLLQTVDQMHRNIEAIKDTSEKIEDVMERTNALNENAGQFLKKTEEIKRKMWCKNCKVTLEKVCNT